MLRNFASLLLTSLLFVLSPVTGLADAPKTPLFLLPNAPTFDMTISQFRSAYNHQFPDTPLYEYRTIDVPQTKHLVTAAVSRITPTLYSSTALEPGTGKLKTVQITLIGYRHQNESEHQLALDYMASLLLFFSPDYNRSQSLTQLEQWLKKSKSESYFLQNDGPVRYIFAEMNNTLTFAIEPLRLIMNPENNLDTL